MMTLLDTALRTVRSLPPLPTAILQLSKLVQQPFPEVDEVTAIVERDPALIAAILRVANSAEVGARCEVSNVKRAISQVGPREAIEIAMTSAFAGYLPRRLPGYNITREDFIKHAVTVGRLTDSICRQLAILPTADAFTCGLVHDCGKLVLCRLLDMKNADIKFAPDQGSSPWIHAERAILGMDHTILGEALARAWSLPTAILGTARWHHHPWQAPPEVDVRLCAAMHIADEHAHALQGEDRAPHPGALDILRIDARLLEHVLEQATALCAKNRSDAA